MNTVAAEDLPFGVKAVHEGSGCVARRVEPPADDDFHGIFPYIEILKPCVECSRARASYERAVEAHKDSGITAEYIAGRLGKGRVKGDVMPHISEHGYFVDPIEAIGGLA